MKQILAALILVLSTVFVSCEPETMLTVDQTSLSFTDAGGSSSITLTANKPWSATSNQSWCKVSPSGGEEAMGSRITITCDANTTYDARNATVTITCAELTKQISISQATNNGLLVSQTSYELTKAAQQLNIQVQANVKFSVDVDNSCKDWIKYNSTKGLSTSTVVLDIAENKSYDSREGKVTIKQDGGNLSSTVTIKQSQLDGLFITTPEYNLSNETHTLTVEVSTNVEFDVKPEADWVKYVQTKGLNTKQIVLQVEENDTYDQRETKVNVKQKNGDLNGVISIRQESNGIVEFEDLNFKAYCIGYDNDNDGEISFLEAKNIKMVHVITDNISSLSGIEYFENLEYLFCCVSFYDGGHGYGYWKDGEMHYIINDVEVKGQLKSLDVSNNKKLQRLYCCGNQLTSLDLGNCAKLNTLWCNGNRLQSLDISNCPELISLDCSENHLIELDVSQNTSLTGLYCGYNQLTALNIRENTALTNLWCRNNQLTALDLANCLALSELFVDNNRLSTLDVSRNTALTFLGCRSNQLTTLTVGDNQLLKSLDCSDNQLSILNVGSLVALEDISCSENMLKSLDLSNNTTLVQLLCKNNQLTSLDVGNCSSLTTVWCYFNQLSSLDFSNNQRLENLICSHNQLTAINVTKCASLSYLECGDNQLTVLDITRCPLLTGLQCSSNQLTSLDVSKNTALMTMWCNDNPYLTEIWLKTGQTIEDFNYDTEVATIKYK